MPDTHHPALPDPFPEGMGVAPDRDHENDDDWEFDDRDPTLADAIRLWHEGIEWYRDSTVLGIRQFGGGLSARDESQRRIWIASVRNVEASGLVDHETAIGLIDGIMREYFYNCHNLDDPEQERISDEMGVLCRLHGLPEGKDFTGHPNPPPEWTALVAAGDARDEEQLREILVECGVSEVWRLRSERRAEYDAVVARVDARLEADYEEAHRQRYGRESRRHR